MKEIPDLRIQFDSLINQENRIEFFWTMTGTHEISGNIVKVKGSEEWVLEDNLIAACKGNFPGEIYMKQIESGSAN